MHTTDTESPAHPLRILHLEDDRHDREIVEKRLKADGLDCEFVHAGTRQEFEAAILQPSYDLILSDIDLPDMDGFEICHRLKQNPKLQAIPVILMSGRLAEGNEARALKIGAADYLSKPFGAETVVKKISAHIRGGKNGKGTT